MLLDVPMWKRNFRRTATVAGVLLGFAGVGMLYIEQLDTERSAIPHSEYGILILQCAHVSDETDFIRIIFRRTLIETFHAVSMHYKGFPFHTPPQEINISL